MRSAFLMSILLILSPTAWSLSGQLPNPDVRGDYSGVLKIHADICQAKGREAPSGQVSLTDVSADNLLLFIEDPYSYTAIYRSQLDDYFISMNGGREILESQALRTVSLKSEVNSEVEAMLRWNSRDYMIALQYEFCANALGLENVIFLAGCSQTLDFSHVGDFCKNPYQY